MARIYKYDPAKLSETFLYIKIKTEKKEGSQLIKNYSMQLIQGSIMIDRNNLNSQDVRADNERLSIVFKKPQWPIEIGNYVYRDKKVYKVVKTDVDLLNITQIKMIVEFYNFIDEVPELKKIIEENAQNSEIEKALEQGYVSRGLFEITTKKINADIDEIKKENKTAKTNIENNYVTNTLLTTEKQAISNDIEALKTKSEQITTDITNNYVKNTILETKLTQLTSEQQTKLDQKQNKLTDTQINNIDQITTNLNNINTKITQTNSKIESDINSKATQLENSIATKQNTLTETQLANINLDHSTLLTKTEHNTAKTELETQITQNQTSNQTKIEQAKTELQNAINQKQNNLSTEQLNNLNSIETKLNTKQNNLTTTQLANINLNHETLLTKTEFSTEKTAIETKITALENRPIAQPATVIQSGTLLDYKPINIKENVETFTGRFIKNKKEYVQLKRGIFRLRSNQTVINGVEILLKIEGYVTRIINGNTQLHPITNSIASDAGHFSPIYWENNNLYFWADNINKLQEYNNRPYEALIYYLKANDKVYTDKEIQAILNPPKPTPPINEPTYEDNPLNPKIFLVLSSAIERGIYSENSAATIEGDVFDLPQYNAISTTFIQNLTIIDANDKATITIQKNAPNSNEYNSWSLQYPFGLSMVFVYWPKTLLFQNANEQKKIIPNISWSMKPGLNEDVYILHMNPISNDVDGFNPSKDKFLILLVK